MRVGRDADMNEMNDGILGNTVMYLYEYAFMFMQYHSRQYGA